MHTLGTVLDLDNGLINPSFSLTSFSLSVMHLLEIVGRCSLYCGQRHGKYHGCRTALRNTSKRTCSCHQKLCLNVRSLSHVDNSKQKRLKVLFYFTFDTAISGKISFQMISASILYVAENMDTQKSTVVS